MMNFECEMFGLKGRSSGSIFGQVNTARKLADGRLLFIAQRYVYLSCTVVQYRAHGQLQLSPAFHIDMSRHIEL